MDDEWEYTYDLGNLHIFTSLRDGNRPHRIVGLTQQRYIYIYKDHICTYRVNGPHC